MAELSWAEKLSNARARRLRLINENAATQKRSREERWQKRWQKIEEEKAAQKTAKELKATEKSNTWAQKRPVFGDARWVTAQSHRDEAKRHKDVDRELRQRANQMLQGAKSRAAQKKLPFDLTSDFLVELLRSGFCAATGVPLYYHRKRRAATPSLDRVTPTLGYVQSNVRIVCLAYNFMKGTWTDEECLAIATALVERANSLPHQRQDQLQIQPCSEEEQAQEEPRHPSDSTAPEDLQELDPAA